MSKVKKYLKKLIYRYKDDDVPSLASQLAYSLLTSFFPFLIFLITLVGFSSIRSDNVLKNMSLLLPQSAYELIEKTVIEVVNTKSGSLLSASLFISIWSGSSGFRAVIRGLNKAYDEPETRGYIKVQIITLFCTVGLAFIIIFIIILLVFGEVLGNYLQCCYRFSEIYRYLWDLIRYLISGFSLIFTFALLYLVTPCRKLKWKEVIPGALFSTIGWLIASLLFSFYVNNFGNYSRFYGSIGAVFILMTWLYITSVIIIMGGELNAIFLNKN
jgi:membrane protein